MEPSQSELSSKSLDSTPSAHGTAVSSTTATTPTESFGGNGPTSTQDGDDKAQRIVAACDERNYAELIELSTTPGGFLSDHLRCKAWPLLLGSHKYNRLTELEVEGLPEHADEEQVKLDVDRSFVYYPNNASEAHMKDLKSQLQTLITYTLRTHPYLSYFQGYHDIAQVLLLVLGAERARPALVCLSTLRIRDFMLPSFSGAFAHLHLILPLLQSADPSLAHLLRSTVQRTQSAPFWALAATITLYAHDITSYGQIARLFDFLIAKEAVASIYLFVAIVMARKEELLDIPEDEPEMLHFTLSKLPEPLNIDALVDSAMALLGQHPPKSLPNRAWSRVSENSVLKTTVPPTTVCDQTEAEAREYFVAQAREIRRKETLEKAWKNARISIRRHRVLLRRTGLAVVVGVLAFALNTYSGHTGTFGIGGGFLGRVLSRFQFSRA